MGGTPHFVPESGGSVDSDSGTPSPSIDNSGDSDTPSPSIGTSGDSDTPSPFSNSSDGTSAPSPSSDNSDDGFEFSFLSQAARQSTWDAVASLVMMAGLWGGRHILA